MVRRQVSRKRHPDTLLMRSSGYEIAPEFRREVAMLARNLRQNSVFRAIRVNDRCHLSKSRGTHENSDFTFDSPSGNVALGV